MQPFEVQQGKFCIFIGSIWISPINIYTSTRGNPGVAVLCVHQVKVFDLIVTVGIAAYWSQLFIRLLF